MATGDHPDVPFVQAKKYGAGRLDGPPIWIVWHTMEEHEAGDTAERVANYFATLPDGRSVSAHYCCDNNSVVQCVLLADRAWTVGNTPGNNRGINVELAGFAAQSRAQWTDPYSLAMLSIACRIVARDMTEFAIPNRWCTVDDLKARRPGHTTHNDLRLAFGGTTHTDPGPNFPRDIVLDYIATGGTTVSSPVEEYTGGWLPQGIVSLADPIEIPEKASIGYKRNLVDSALAKALGRIEAKVDELLARPSVEVPPIDQAQVDAAVLAAMSNPDVIALYAKAVVDEEQRRLES
jgi:hypothetical protein